MPGISGPLASAFPYSRRAFISPARFAPVASSRPVVRLLALLALVTLCSLTATAQGVGDVTDVHITPHAKAEATSAAAAPDATTPSVGLKSTNRSIKVNVNLVLMPVTVTDPMNRLVTGLERDNFALAEGSQGQQISSFSSEDAPLSLGVIFDMSGSMSNKIEKSKQAVIEFFKTANPDDEFFMIGFSDKPELLADFTNSIEDIQSQLV